MIKRYPQAGCVRLFIDKSRCGSELQTVAVTALRNGNLLMALSRDNPGFYVSEGNFFPQGNVSETLCGSVGNSFISSCENNCFIDVCPTIHSQGRISRSKT